MHITDICTNYLQMIYKSSTSYLENCRIRYPYRGRPPAVFTISITGFFLWKTLLKIEINKQNCNFNISLIFNQGNLFLFESKFKFYLIIALRCINNKRYFVRELYSSKYQNQMSNYWIFFKNAQMASSDWTAAGRVHFLYMAISVFKHVHAKRSCVISWMGAKTASIILKQLQCTSNVVQLIICVFFYLNTYFQCLNIKRFASKQRPI